MKICDLYKQKNSPVFSAEVIPPRNGDPIADIDETVKHLKDYDMKFISVTWGAGGSLRGGTLPIAARIKYKFGIETMAHVTCRDFSIQQMENTLVDAKLLGITNILALRGDPPRGESAYSAKPDGYQFANELVEHLSELRKGLYLKRVNEKDVFKTDYKPGEPYDVSICVAAHPEGHCDCPSPADNIVHFKKKVDAGADMAITQMVFSAKVYEDFLKETTAAGITIPIIPSIYLMQSYGFLSHMPFFNTTLPAHIKAEVEKNRDKPEAIKQICFEHTLDMCRKLLKIAPGLHFYTMNNPKNVIRLIESI